MRKLIVTAALSAFALATTGAYAQQMNPEPAGLSAPKSVPYPPASLRSEPHAALRLDAENVPTPRRTLPNAELLATGALVFGTTYGASVFVAAVNNTAYDRQLYYPVVGPWLDLTGRTCAGRTCALSGWNQALLVGDGVLQAGGVFTALLGFFVPSTVTRGAFFFLGDTKIGVTPARVGSSGYGLSAAGSF